MLVSLFSKTIVSKHAAKLHACNVKAGHIQLRYRIKINLYHCDEMRKIC